MSANIVKDKLQLLATQLAEQVPNIATTLRDIHQTIKKDPDVATILTEEEVSILVTGLKQQTKTEIATAAAKTKSKKPLKSITVDDL